MLLTAFVRKQLVGLAVAGSVALIVLLVHYLKVPAQLGWGTYQVSADFAQGAMLYEGAEVTYLGHPVGRVSDMALSEQGVEVTLRIDDSVAIPGNVQAEIHSMSAVGEQFVDLVPETTSTGRLREGARIPREQTSHPLEIGPVLDHVEALVDSLPVREVDRLVVEAGTALQGRDGDLRAILDSGQGLLGEAQGSLRPTKRLIREAGPLLETVESTSPHLERLSSQLAAVTATLRAGDEDLRRLLRDGPGGVGEVTSFVRQVEPELKVLLPQYRDLAELLGLFRGNLAFALSRMPAMLAGVLSNHLPREHEQEAKFTLTNVNDPAPCLKGFLPVAQWRDPADLSVVDTPLLYCAEPSRDPRVVKGARNLPCPNNPAIRTARVEECGLFR